MCLRTMLVVCCAMVYFGSGQANVLMTNSVYNNTNEPVVKQCAELFQYCQSNQDCCSRNCLSFSYKCIRERTEQPELPSHGNNQQPESPISGSASAGTAGSVQELVDRFGSDDGPDVNAAIPQRPSDSNAFVAPFRPPQQPDIQAPINIQGNRPCLTTGGNCLQSSQCCSGQCSRITNQCIVGDEQLQFLPQSRPVACSSTLGSHCFSQEDCCAPLRCHDFAHHCVE